MPSSCRQRPPRHAAVFFLEFARPPRPASPAFAFRLRRNLDAAAFFLRLRLRQAIRRIRLLARYGLYLRLPQRRHLADAISSAACSPSQVVDRAHSSRIRIERSAGASPPLRFDFARLHTCHVLAVGGVIRGVRAARALACMISSYDVGFFFFLPPPFDSSSELNARPSTGWAVEFHLAQTVHPRPASA